MVRFSHKGMADVVLTVDEVEHFVKFDDFQYVAEYYKEEVMLEFDEE